MKYIRYHLSDLTYKMARIRQQSGVRKGLYMNKARLSQLKVLYEFWKNRRETGPDENRRNMQLQVERLNAHSAYQDQLTRKNYNPLKWAGVVEWVTLASELDKCGV